MYRRAAEVTVERTITAVRMLDPDYGRNADKVALESFLVDATIGEVRRVGKLLLVDVERGVLGIRFGMTGRLVVDDAAVIDQLEYSSRRLAAEWNRFAVSFAGGGSMVINDPRRLGSVEIDPDVARLGVDAWGISAEELTSRLVGRRPAIKAFLLDQKRVAGLGNLLADELLWRAGIDPHRVASALTADEIIVLTDELEKMLPELYERGGSNTGDLFEHRHPDGRCPTDGEPLARSTVGGRTTWWCPTHQI